MRCQRNGVPVGTVGDALLHHFGSITQKAIKLETGQKDLGDRDYFYAKRRHGLARAQAVQGGAQAAASRGSRRNGAPPATRCTRCAAAVDGCRPTTSDAAPMSRAAAAPRASLLLLAYNQERYAEEAARSCLAQESEPLEIVFSDDASSDRTHEILATIAAEYRGPHRVVVRRNETNLGITGHYNRLVEESPASC